MAIETPLSRRLGLRHPIIQAPLAGGGDTPALVAAVSDAGALGFIGAAYLTAAQIAETARVVRAMTTRPFGINLFIATPLSETPNDPSPAIARLAPYFAELGLPPPALPQTSASSFDAQFAAALASGAAVFGFTLGLMDESAAAAVKARKMFLVGTATTVEEAIALERRGVEAVVVQGSEAGGHRATFAGEFAGAMIGTMALVPQVVDAVRIPVIASGGVMDGRGIAASLALGAEAVQMGTAFLVTAEAGIPDVYKQAILTAAEHETRITRAFSGRPARGIVNRFMREIDAAEREAAGDILPFPLQNALTRPLRAEAARRGRSEFLSLWAGQGVRMARPLPASQLVARLGEETVAALRRVCAASPSVSSALRSE